MLGVSLLVEEIGFEPEGSITSDSHRSLLREGRAGSSEAFILLSLPYLVEGLSKPVNKTNRFLFLQM
mgnify:CR=1 FL=1